MKKIGIGIASGLICIMGLAQAEDSMPILAGKDVFPDDDEGALPDSVPNESQTTAPEDDTDDDDEETEQDTSSNYD